MNARTGRGSAALALLLWVLPLPAATERWLEGTVVHVSDGDTVDVKDGTGKHRVRFYGVDAPELAHDGRPAQAYGAQADAFVRRLLLHRHVRVRLTGETSYRRAVGEVFVDEKSASRELLRAGLAWWNARHARDDGELRRLERAAREARAGLWREPQPVPPWKFRRRGRR
ncbi:MAG: thermonuclease family protein [Gammaproteobacteria bacterium]|nr:thermonuclease family protein [Gammaproteobacteria bacterium]